MTRFGLSVAALLIASAGVASAQELKIGLSAEPSAMDPHFHNLTPNNSMTKHIFDRVVDQDENQNVKPMLATSWKTLDETTWEFKLRAGVKFSDGSDFTANDVIYSYCRVPKVENSPSSLAINVRAIIDMTAPDPLTLRDQDREPASLAAERDFRPSACSRPRPTAPAR